MLDLAKTVEKLKAQGIRALPDVPKGTKVLLFQCGDESLYLKRGIFYNLAWFVLTVDAFNGTVHEYSDFIDTASVNEILAR